MVDIIFVELATGNLVIGDNSGDILAPAFFLGVGGWWLLPAGPKHMYEKKYTLNKLIPIPKKKAEEKNLFVDQAAVKIEENHVRWDYYENFADYKKGNKMHSSSSGNKVTYENTTFGNDLNKLLIKYQYCDTTKKLLANTFNSMRLRTTITEYGSILAGNMYCIELRTQWDLHDYYAETLSRWEDKNIRNDSTASSIAEAIKAVVTINTPKGHGSGCIISQEGLVLTNYHVSGDSSSKVEILFEDGTKDSGVVIRINPIYDLALIKIKPVSVKPLKINLAKTIEVGTEVFAIGTPEDMNLGQTVTKGIISGRRKVDEKVYIQTDVSISPGNSGGALITKDGLVIGIINAKIIGKGVEGIGFAIPAYYIEDAMKIKFEN